MRIIIIKSIARGENQLTTFNYVRKDISDHDKMAVSFAGN